VGSSISTKIW